MRSVYFKSLALVVTVAGLLAGPPSVSAQTLIFSWDKEWSYNDSGTDQGTAWRQKVFAGEASWSTGPGVLVARRPPSLNENLPTLAVQQGAQNRTLVNLAPAGSEQTMRTHYFRTHFTLPVAPNNVILTMSNVVDDAAVWYLNGEEVGRFNLPAYPTPINWTTAASGASEATTYGVVVVTASTNLFPGDNVIAVETHQGGANSSDMVFGMTLSYKVITVPVITVQPRSQTVDNGLPFSLSVGAVGDSLSYQWQKDDGTGTFVDIPGAVGATYSVLRASSAHSGNYKVIVSNAGGSATSQVATISVVADQTRPTILSAIAQPNFPPYRVVVTFSEPVDIVTGRNSANYSIDQDGGANTLTVSVLGFPQGPVVNLEVSEWNTNLNYILTVNNVKDRNGNFIMPESKVGLGFRNGQLIFPMNHNWRWWEDGDIAFFDPDGEWKTNGLSTDVVPYFGEGPGVFFFEFNQLPDLCAGSAQTIISAGVLTHYFTTTFTLPTVSPEAQFEMHSVIDDGAIIYLNGQEINRYNMPAGEVSYLTPASTGVGNATCVTNANISVNNLRSGENVVAVELHQVSFTTTDWVFGAEFVAFLTQFHEIDPELFVDHIGDDIMLFWNGPGQDLEYTDDLINGPWTTVSATGNHYREALSTAAQRFWRLRRR